jgi:phosphatidylethanolamine/phosphatidyl-N-methylethanolamine N-methyltransferase
MTATCQGRRAATVEGVYRRLAPVYDVLYGWGLQQGRDVAMRHLAPMAGETICEIGIGTGLSARGYPAGCRVVGLDLSAAMLSRARRLVAAQGLGHVSLCRMDATNLAFRERQFDAVYAPYVINVVPAPLRVARELARVCRPGGRLVFLNHFAGTGVRPRRLDSVLGSAASWLGGVDWHLDLETFVDQAGLHVRSVEPVNAGVSHVLVCDVPWNAGS